MSDCYQDLFKLYHGFLIMHFKINSMRMDIDPFNILDPTLMEDILILNIKCIRLVFISCSAEKQLMHNILLKRQG